MAYNLHYSDYSTTTGGPPDPERWVGPPGPPGPQGIPGPQGPQGASGGIAEAPTDGAIYGRQGTTTSWQGVLPLTAGSSQALTGPLYLPSALPTAGQQATNKTYVDQQDAALQNAISAVAQNLVFVGQCHVPTDSTLFTPASGITPSPGPLPLATSVPKGTYVIIVEGGTPPGGSHIPAGSYTLHDWLISDGTTWVWLQLGLASYMASDIPINPAIGSLGANVQTGLQWLSDHSGVASFNTRIGAVTLSSGDVTTALTFTPYNATNPSGYQTSVQVTTALAAGSPGAFSTLSAAGTVSGAGFTMLLSPYALASSVPVASSTAPVMDGTATIGVGTTWARADHIHPTDTSRYAAANPSGYQTAANVTTALAAGQPGAFSTLSASGVVSGAGFSTYLASPPAIGGTAAAAGTFTNLAVSGTVSGGGFTTLLSPYALLAAPVFTGDARAVTAAIGDNDTSIATTAFVQAAVAMPLHDVGRNYLDNSLFNIAQRTLPVAVTGYTLDRWRAEIVTDAASFSQATLADADRTAIGDEEAQSAVQNVFTGNAAVGAYNMLQQRIENSRRLSGKTVIASFWAKAAAGTPKLGVSIDQVWNGVATTGTGTAVTLSTAWTRYTASFAVPTGSGKTQVANDYTQLNIWFSSGTTNATRSGTVGVQSGTVQLWGMQLEIGTVATPVEKLEVVFQLLQCQRFYAAGSIRFIGYQAAGNAAGYMRALPVPMRANPTFTPTYTTQTNCTGAATQWDAQTFYEGVTATALGAFTLAGTYTASADL